MDQRLSVEMKKRKKRGRLGCEGSEQYIFDRIIMENLDKLLLILIK